MLYQNAWSPLPQDKLVNIEFRDVTYKVAVRRNDYKEILKEINGEFKAGELSAILGPSGSGKTTLLNILAAYKCQKSSGTILVNNQPRDVQKFTNISRYIMQEDALVQQLTILETMATAANLKLGRSSFVYRTKMMNDILKSLKLYESRHTSTSKLSGGERKRLSIGLELINNPSILILDEPTTGLDEYSCGQCINLLKDLAKSGRTVICSLHTPSARVLSSFDNIYVLNSGQCVFQGDSFQIISYLSNVNLHCPSSYNPADFIIEVCNGAYGDYQDALVAMTQNGKLTFRKDEVPQNKLSIKTYDIKSKILEKETQCYEYGADWFTQFRILTTRMWLQMWRDRVHFAIKFICLLAIGTLIGLMYQNKGQDGSKTIEVYIGFVALIIFIAYYHGVPAVLHFPTTYNSSKREYFNKWYSLSAYYCAFSVSTLHFHLASGVSFVFIVYMIENHPLEIRRFVPMTSMLIVTGYIAETLAQTISTVFKMLNAIFTFLIILAFFIILIIFELSPNVEIPIWVQVFLNISFVRYSFKGILSSMFEGRKRLECLAEFCYYPDVDRFARTYGTGVIAWWIDILALIGILAVLKITGYMLLKLKMSKRISLPQSWKLFG